MSRGWWVPDLAPRSRAWISIPGPGPHGLTFALGNKLSPDHGHLPRGLDTQPDLPTLQADNGHTDVVSDEELFHQLPSQHQHDILPSSTDVIGSNPSRPAFGALPSRLRETLCLESRLHSLHRVKAQERICRYSLATALPGQSLASAQGSTVYSVLSWRN